MSLKFLKKSLVAIPSGTEIAHAAIALNLHGISKMLIGKKIKELLKEDTNYNDLLTFPFTNV